MPPIRTVVFDFGETLVDESEPLGQWADWLGVRRHAFFAVLGSVIGQGRELREVFQVLRPGIDIAAERRAREAAGVRWGVTAADVYPDAAPCLRKLRQEGWRVGIAGNQPEAVEAMVPQIGLEADFVASSGRWGVSKPDQRFFQLVSEAAGCPPEEIAYVGDRVDNDVVPAKRAGMAAILLRRGPWGYVQSDRPEAACADALIHSLDEVVGVLEALRASASA